jgi:hypothetical protein
MVVPGYDHAATVAGTVDAWSELAGLYSIFAPVVTLSSTLIVGEGVVVLGAGAGL